ncbi:MAG: hypothetical protein ACJ8AI_17845, partial [Rhodopila sp.]
MNGITASGPVASCTGDNNPSERSMTRQLIGAPGPDQVPDAPIVVPLKGTSQCRNCRADMLLSL